MTVADFCVQIATRIGHHSARPYRLSTGAVRLLVDPVYPSDRLAIIEFAEAAGLTAYRVEGAAVFGNRAGVRVAIDGLELP